MFEDRLKDLRKKKGVTQAQVAESIYVSRSLIAKFETGAAYPNRETLEKLALYFDVPVSDLIVQDETTLIAVETKDISKRIRFISLVFILALAAIYSIIVFIPMLKGNRYVYPIPPGQDYPNREYFFASIFSGTFEHGNPIGLISFFLSFALVYLSFSCFIFKEKRYSAFLRLATYLLFFVDAFVCVASVIFCLSYIS